MLHYLDRIFPEHLKYSPKLMSCYDAFLKGLETIMFSVRGKKKSIKIFINLLHFSLSFPSSALLSQRNAYKTYKTVAMPRNLPFWNSICTILVSVVFVSLNSSILHSLIAPCLIHVGSEITILFFPVGWFSLIQRRLLFHKVAKPLQKWSPEYEYFYCVGFVFLPTYPTCIITVKILLLYTLKKAANAQTVFSNACNGSEIHTTNYIVLWAGYLTSSYSQQRSGEQSMNLHFNGTWKMNILVKWIDLVFYVKQKLILIT